MPRTAGVSSKCGVKADAAKAETDQRSRAPGPLPVWLPVWTTVNVLPALRLFVLFGHDCPVLIPCLRLLGLLLAEDFVDLLAAAHGD